MLNPLHDVALPMGRHAILPGRGVHDVDRIMGERELATMLTSGLERAKGSYVLVLQLAETKRLSVGKLGTFAFPTGLYLYFGSALNGLAGRVRRHLRQDKKAHWHVDALTAEAEVVEVAWVLGADRYECSWARAAVEHAGATIPARGFGSSDCHCSSHLVYLGQVLSGERASERWRSVLDTLPRSTRMHQGLPAGRQGCPPMTDATYARTRDKESLKKPREGRS